MELTHLRIDEQVSLGSRRIGPTFPLSHTLLTGPNSYIPIFSGGVSVKAGRIYLQRSRLVRIGFNGFRVYLFRQV